MPNLTKQQLRAALARMMKTVAAEKERADRAERLLHGLGQRARQTMVGLGMDLAVTSIEDLITTLTQRALAAEQKASA